MGGQDPGMGLVLVSESLVLSEALRAQRHYVPFGRQRALTFPSIKICPGLFLLFDFFCVFFFFCNQSWFTNWSRMRYTYSYVATMPTKHRSCEHFSSSENDAINADFRVNIKIKVCVVGQSTNIKQPTNNRFTNKSKANRQRSPSRCP